MVVHAGRQQRRPYAVPGAFLAGYALVWTAFALLAFLGDAQIHWLVRHWFWLALHSWVIGATTFAIAGVFQFSPLKACCLNECRRPFRFFRHSYRKGVGAAWRLGLRHGFLPGELLGVDAGDVRSGSGQPAVDGGADRGHGGGEDLSWRAAAQPGHRDHLAGTCRPLAGPFCLALGGHWGLST